MYRKSFKCLCIALCFLGVRCQRNWGSNIGYNSGYSNSWNSRSPSSSSGSGGSNTQKAFENAPGSSFGKPYRGGGGAKPWESSPLNSDRNPKDEIYSSENKKNWGYETSSNGAKPNSGDSSKWQSDVFNVRPNEGMTNSNFEPNVGSSGSNKWSSNSNKFSANNDVGISTWESGRPPSTNNVQNSRPGNWNSNDINSSKLTNSVNNNENDILSETDYEGNPGISTWGTNNNKYPNSISNSNSGYGKWEATTEKRNKNKGAPKWESNYYNKPKKPSANSQENTLKPGNNRIPTNSNQQTGAKPPTLDTSILDELDKNDWYFGKESNYPNPPLRTINIDVSELWNFDKNKKSNLNSKGNSNNKNNNRRRNRQIELSEDVGEGVQCECVSVEFCEEEDMIITQEDIKYDPRPLEAFRCNGLTEVCCTNPRTWAKKRINLSEEKETLQCGQRKIRKNNAFGKINEYTAEPGEFPWMLTLENAGTSCSATLIHHKLALTAAHCTSGALLNQLVLKAGVWNSNAELSQTRRVARIIPHPEYSSLSPRNDIALLVVEEPFELTENVNSVCLPMTNDKWDSSQCVVAGWKPEEIDGQVLKVLEKGIVNFLPQAECQNIMLVTDLWRNYILHDSFVCGLEKTGRHSCIGDEGGFLICPSNKKPDTYLQIGIVSKGINCDKFGRPGIFTNVLKFLDWINRNYFELELFDDIDVRSMT